MEYAFFTREKHQHEIISCLKTLVCLHFNLQFQAFRTKRHLKPVNCMLNMKQIQSLRLIHNYYLLLLVQDVLF